MQASLCPPTRICLPQRVRGPYCRLSLGVGLSRTVFGLPCTPLGRHHVGVRTVEVVAQTISPRSGVDELCLCVVCERLGSGALFLGSISALLDRKSVV